MTRSAASTLLVGDRVRNAYNRDREGVVTEIIKESPSRFVYMVRWDGCDHDSGEYGIRSLELIRG